MLKKILFSLIIFSSVSHVSAYESTLQNDFSFNLGYENQTQHKNKLLNPNNLQDKQQLTAVAGLFLRYDNKFFLETQLVSQIDNIDNGNYQDSSTSIKLKIAKYTANGKLKIISLLSADNASTLASATSTNH